jgi:hypothetical protein
MSLLAEMIGAPSFSKLPVEVQRIYGAEGGEFRGCSVVTRGHGLLSRVFGWLASLPAEQTDADTMVRIDVHPRGQTWTRRFGPCAMRSELHAEGGLVHERVGLVHFAFALALLPDSTGLEWQVRRVWAFGIPLPLSFFGGVSARSFADAQGVYAFLFEASLPGIGLIVRYAGHLA